MLALLVIYVLGLLYFLPPVEGYSLRYNTTMAFLWPAALGFLLGLFVFLGLIAVYDVVKNKILYER